MPEPVPSIPKESDEDSERPRFEPPPDEPPPDTSLPSAPKPKKNH